MAFKKRRPWDSQPQEAAEPNSALQLSTLLVPSCNSWTERIGSPWTYVNAASFQESILPDGRAVKNATGAYLTRAAVTDGALSIILRYTPNSVSGSVGIWSASTGYLSASSGQILLQRNGTECRLLIGGAYRNQISNAFEIGKPTIIVLSISTVTASATGVVARLTVNGVQTTSTFSNGATSYPNEYFGSGYNSEATGYYGEFAQTRSEISSYKALEISRNLWSELYAPQPIWVPVSAGGGGTPVGTSTETDTSLTLAGAQLRAVGQAAETDAAQALAAVQITAAGTASETDTALALTPVQSTQVGVALETDTALELSSSAGTAPGIASESDTAFALAAVQKLVVGAALEVDTALALTVPGGTLDTILKILRNRQELNPATGIFTIYDDDGTTVLYTANAWADAAGTVPYSGGALRRIDALT